MKLKWNLILLCGIMCALVLATGCSSTSTITEFDENGKVTKVTETKQDMTNAIVSSTKDKTVILFREAYVVGFSATPASEATSSIMSLECVYAHKNTGIISIKPDQKGVPYFADIIRAMKQTDSVSVSSAGVSSSASTGTGTSIDQTLQKSGTSDKVSGTGE